MIANEITKPAKTAITTIFNVPLDDDTSLEDTKLKLDKAKTNLDKLNLQVDVLKAQQQNTL